MKTIKQFQSRAKELFINPLPDRWVGGGGQKGPPTSFSPVTSTNVGFGPQNLLTFSFNSFATQVQNFKFVLVPVPNY